MSELELLKRAFEDVITDYNNNDITPKLNNEEMNAIYNFIDTKITTKEEYKVLYNIYGLSSNAGYSDGYEDGRFDALMN